MQEVNVNTITDMKELKSLAYDQIAAKETAEKNLQMINNRIVQVAQEGDNKAVPKADPAAASAGDAGSDSAPTDEPAADN